jgi:hypothetical protein
MAKRHFLVPHLPLGDVLPCTMSVHNSQENTSACQYEAQSSEQTMLGWPKLAGRITEQTGAVFFIQMKFS